MGDGNGEVAAAAAVAVQWKTPLGSLRPISSYAIYQFSGIHKGRTFPDGVQGWGVALAASAGGRNLNC
jgi:hypothetical protein